ncbi:MAG: hypothetical protein MHM6MM_004580 [Cercozoa sp. M6MM]
MHNKLCNDILSSLFTLVGATFFIPLLSLPVTIGAIRAAKRFGTKRRPQAIPIDVGREGQPWNLEDV